LLRCSSTKAGKSLNCLVQGSRRLMPSCMRILAYQAIVHTTKQGLHAPSSKDVINIMEL
jgi:hypothetical protein